MRIINLIPSASNWLESKSSQDFTKWLDLAPSAVKVGFSWLGLKPDDPLWPSFVQEQIRRVAPAGKEILHLSAQERITSLVSEAVTRAFRLLDKSTPDLDLYLVAGLGWNNGAQGWWDGRGLVFIFVENYLYNSYPDLPKLGNSELIGWTAHEISHATRYTSDSDFDLLRKNLASGSPLDFQYTLNKLPLLQRLKDEGRAVKFSLEANPGMSLEQCLGMTSKELLWLQNHGLELWENRKESWEINKYNPKRQWLEESLYTSNLLPTSTWTINHPPNRWGYYIGSSLVGLHSLPKQAKEIKNSSLLL